LRHVGHELICIGVKPRKLSGANLTTAQTSKAPPADRQPVTAHEQLHADRARLTGELAGLNASSARLRETANAEAAVLREIGEMGSAEIAAMTAWASAGCVGDPPAPDQKQRRALVEKLSAAQSAAAAAKGAGQDIDHQIAELNQRLRSIGDEIEQTAFDLVGREHNEVIAEYRAVCERCGQLAAKISGLAMYYRDAGHLQQASVISATKLPNPGTNRLEIMAAADAWGRRITDLRRSPA
jgi:hypothetical protein